MYSLYFFFLFHPVDLYTQVSTAVSVVRSLSLFDGVNAKVSRLLVDRSVIGVHINFWKGYKVQPLLFLALPSLPCPSGSA